MRYSTLMYWRQSVARKLLSAKKGTARAMITRIDSKLESKRDVPQSEKVVVEMGRGIHVYQQSQTSRAGRRNSPAIGVGRGR